MTTGALSLSPGSTSQQKQAGYNSTWKFSSENTEENFRKLKQED
jgi:hypothetical protein